MGKNTVTSVVRDAMGEVNQVISNTASTTQQKMGAVGSACSTIGSALLPVSTAVGGVGLAAANSAISFETSMAKVQTIAGKTAVSYKGNTQSMSDAIKALSSDTGIAAGEIAEATYSAISAGVDTSKSVEFVAKANALAVGGFTDMNSAVDVLTTAINAYGLSADDAGMVSDRLITTQNLGKTTVDELAGSIGRVIPSASAYGVSIDNLCASYVQMTKGGIATSEATTYMKSMLNELADSGSGVGKVLQEQTGKSFTDLMASGASLGDVMGILGQSVDGNTSAFAQLWGSQEAGTGALSLLNAGCEDFNNVMVSMKDSTGAANSAFETMNDTTGHKLQVALNNVKNAGIELGQTLLTTLGPVITNVCKTVSDLCKWFSNLPGPVKSTITSIMGIVAVAGPVLIVVGKIISGLSGLIGIVGKVGSVFKLLPAVLGVITSPVGIVVAAIAALVGGFVYLWNTSEGFRNFWIGLWNGIKDVCGAVVGAIVSFFTETIPGAWNALVGFFQGIPEWWAGLWQQISDFFLGIWNAILNNPIVQMVCNAVTSLWNTAKDTLSNIWNGICSIASSVWNTISQVIGGLVNGLVSSAVSIFNGFKNTISGIWNAISSTASNVWSGIKNFVVNTATNLKDNAVNAFKNMVSGIGNVLSGIGSVVSNGFKSAINFITSLPGQALSWGKDFIDGLVNGIKSGIKKVTNAVKSVADNIRSFLHFSVPDVGPLTDYESWMPDFMSGLAAGIDANKNLVTRSISSLANEMTIVPSLVQEPPALKNIEVSGGKTKEQQTSFDKFLSLFEKFMEMQETNRNQNNSAGITPGELENIIVRALAGVGIYLDKHQIGKVIAPVVNDEFGKFERRKT